MAGEAGEELLATGALAGVGLKRFPKAEPRERERHRLVCRQTIVARRDVRLFVFIRRSIAFTTDRLSFDPRSEVLAKIHDDLVKRGFLVRKLHLEREIAHRGIRRRELYGKHFAQVGLRMKT